MARRARQAQYGLEVGLQNAYSAQYGFGLTYHVLQQSHLNCTSYHMHTTKSDSQNDSYPVGRGSFSWPSGNASKRLYQHAYCKHTLATRPQRSSNVGIRQPLLQVHSIMVPSPHLARGIMNTSGNPEREWGGRGGVSKTDVDDMVALQALLPFKFYSMDFQSREKYISHKLHQITNMAPLSLLLQYKSSNQHIHEILSSPFVMCAALRACVRVMYSQHVQMTHVSTDAQQLVVDQILRVVEGLEEHLNTLLENGGLNARHVSVVWWCLCVLNVRSRNQSQIIVQQIERQLRTMEPSSWTLVLAAQSESYAVHDPLTNTLVSHVSQHVSQLLTWQHIAGVILSIARLGCMTPELLRDIITQSSKIKGSEPDVEFEVFSLDGQVDKGLRNSTDINLRYACQWLEGFARGGGGGIDTDQARDIEQTMINTVLSHSSLNQRQTNELLAYFAFRGRQGGWGVRLQGAKPAGYDQCADHVLENVGMFIDTLEGKDYYTQLYYISHMNITQQQLHVLEYGLQVAGAGSVLLASLGVAWKYGIFQLFKRLNLNTLVLQRAADRIGLQLTTNNGHDDVTLSSSGGSGRNSGSSSSSADSSRNSTISNDISSGQYSLNGVGIDSVASDVEQMLVEYSPDVLQRRDYYQWLEAYEEAKRPGGRGSGYPGDSG